jgi:hypothetical protein
MDHGALLLWRQHLDFYINAHTIPLLLACYSRVLSIIIIIIIKLPSSRIARRREARTVRTSSLCDGDTSPDLRRKNYVLAALLLNLQD